MTPNSSQKSVNFISCIILLAVVSVAGIFVRDRISWLESSDFLRWGVAVFGSFILSYILFQISFFSSDNSHNKGERFDWQLTKTKGKNHFIQSVMATDLKQFLYFQPLIALFGGYILGWNVSYIIGVVSILTFIAIIASFSRAIRMWELNEKEEEPSEINAA